MSEQSEIVPSMFGSLLGCTLDIDTDNLKLGSCKQLTDKMSDTMVMH